MTVSTYEYWLGFSFLGCKINLDQVLALVFVFVLFLLLSLRVTVTNISFLTCKTNEVMALRP